MLLIIPLIFFAVENKQTKQIWSTAQSRVAILFSLVSFNL